MERAAGVSGVRVTHVMRGSPAATAGVKEGDVLVALSGVRVGSPEDVTRVVVAHAPGDVMIADFSRSQQAITLRVTLATRPSPDEMLRIDRVGAFAPAWVGLEPVGGAPSSLSELRGKVILVDFWASWCRPCRYLAPKLSALQARYGAQGLKVVGVTADSPEVAATFAERLNLRYAVAVDRQGSTARAYDVSALPTLFVIDKRGVVRDVAVGYDDGQEARIEGLVKDLLAEPAPTQ
jgi:thiol-disulfide isomerase/thioredoxin